MSPCHSFNKMQNQLILLQSYFNWAELSADHQHYLLETRALAQPLYKYLFGMSVQSNMSSSGIMWSNCLFTEDKGTVTVYNLLKVSLIHFRSFVLFLLLPTL